MMDAGMGRKDSQEQPRFSPIHTQRLNLIAQSTEKFTLKVTQNLLLLQRQLLTTEMEMISFFSEAEAQNQRALDNNSQHTESNRD